MGTTQQTGAHVVIATAKRRHGKSKKASRGAVIVLAVVLAALVAVVAIAISLASSSGSSHRGFGRMVRQATVTAVANFTSDAAANTASCRRPHQRPVTTREGSADIMWWHDRQMPPYYYTSAVDSFRPHWRGRTFYWYVGNHFRVNIRKVVVRQTDGTCVRQLMHVMHVKAKFGGHWVKVKRVSFTIQRGTSVRDAELEVQPV